MTYAKSLLVVLSAGAAAVTIAAASSPAPRFDSAQGQPFDSAQGKPFDFAQGQPQTGWRYFGGDKGFTRYSPLAQISRDNVRNLRIAWRRPAVNPKMTAAFPDTRPNAYLRSTPIMVDGVLYTQDAHGLVIALDGETGQTIWEQPFGSAREDASGASTRGVDYWRGGVTRTARRWHHPHARAPR